MNPIRRYKANTNIETETVLYSLAIGVVNLPPSRLGPYLLKIDHPIVHRN